MRQRLVAIVWAVAVAVTGALIGFSQTAPADQSRFTTLQVESCPLRILQLTHTSTDLASHAKLRNQTLNRIESYRIGWIAIFTSAPPTIALGKIVNIPSGLKPGEVAEMPAQKVANIPGAAEVRFFVAETTWQGGGWKANLKEIEADDSDNKKQKHPERPSSNPGDSPGR
jgi:hypothetical protein